MRILVSMAVAVMIVGGSFIAFAEEGIPDLKGTWTGDFNILRSSYPQEAGPNPLAFTKPGFGSARGVKYVIDKQQGPLFSGTESFSRSVQKIVGVIDFDNKTLHITDRYGRLVGRIIAPDKIRLIYSENTKHGQVAARGTVTRQKP